MKTFLTYSLLGCLFLTTSISICYAQTGAPIREIACTTYHTDSISWFPFDSTYYLYSGSKGGFPVIAGNVWEYAGKCDTSYYLFNEARTNKYYKSGRTIENFDGHDNVLTNMSQTYDTASNIWTNKYQEIYTYDAGNNEVSHVSQVWDTTIKAWQNITHYKYTYDTNNNVLTDTTLNWFGGMWYYADINLYSYDAYNDLTEQIDEEYSSGTWDSLVKYSHFVNAGHKPDSIIQYTPSASGWSASTKEIYTYDASYNILTDAVYLWNGIIFANASLDIYTYSGGDQISDEHKLPWRDTSWQNQNYTVNTYDAHHNKIRQVEQGWNATVGSYVNFSSVDNHYNADNKPDTTILSAWNYGSASWNSNYRAVYYYAPTTDVKNVNQVACDMHIYPSPANSYMNIDIDWKNAQNATLAIYDMSGRLYKQWTTNPGFSYHSNIPTGNMPVGNYILKVRSNAGQVAEQFSIAH